MLKRISGSSYARIAVALPSAVCRPDKAGSRVGQCVDAVKLSHEVGHKRMVEWCAHPRDVDLGEMVAAVWHRQPSAGAMFIRVRGMLSTVSKLTLRPTLSRPCSQAGFRPHKAGVDLILLEAGDWAGGRVNPDTGGGYGIESRGKRSRMAGL